MKLERTLVALLAAAVMLAGCGPQEPERSQSANPEPMDRQTPSGDAMDSNGSASQSSGTPMQAQTADVPAPIAAAVASPDRPDADKARDADRRPDQVLTFFGVKPGMSILEFVAAGGYYTEILSRLVGDGGHVYATRLEDERIADDRLPNVTAVGDRDWGLDPGSVDMVFTALNYHDLFNIEDLDRPALLARFYDVLKPGGNFAVIDHAAEEGSGSRDTETLHRVDEQTVISEFEDAGFDLADESDVLRHPEDDRTQRVFAEGLRGKTDRFVLKFVKPAS